jgi:hypothetical protein
LTVEVSMFNDGANAALTVGTALNHDVPPETWQPVTLRL